MTQMYSKLKGFSKIIGFELVAGEELAAFCSDKHGI